MILALVAFAGIAGAVYYVANGNPFANNLAPRPINIVQQLDPNSTPIPVTNVPVTPDIAPNNRTFRDILNDLNDAREDASLNPVRLNSRLSNAAAVQVAFNAANLDVTHRDANGDLADVRLEAQGYQWQNVGENLLSNWNINGHEVFELWRNSPTHNANMMNPDFTEVGLAYTVTPLGQVYHAMVLARPQ